MFYRMTEEIAVSVKNVSKKYKLFNSPKERLLEALHPFKKKYHREFWALKDVSMDIHQGQTVGIIGRNGSGKSTLLQVICSILRPTSGSVTVNGRISALLELGAGFNPEFTGRDNVYLNGALMGFSQKEMEGRMPMIEKFADIGQFIDQPVKIYSSGMFVRLAFAAAINVDPDILVVDEALAVGDAKFQQKCYQKFLEFQEAGRTIIFVTHDTNAIVKHCDYAFLLENGAVMESGKPNDVVNRYIDVLEGKNTSRDYSISKSSSITSQQKSENSTYKSDKFELEKFLNEVSSTDNCIHRNNYNKNEYRQKFKKCEIVDYLIICENNYDPIIVRSGDLVNIYMKVKYHQPVEFPLFGITIKTIDGVPIYALNSFYNKKFIPSAEKSEIIVFCFSVKMNLHAGDYFIDFGADEKVDEKSYISLDRRFALVHLTVLEKNRFDGFVDLEADCQEISRKMVN